MNNFYPYVKIRVDNRLDLKHLLESRAFDLDSERKVLKFENSVLNLRILRSRKYF